MPLGRPRRPRDQAAARELERFAADYRRRLGKLESDLDKLRSERDKAIRKAHKAGLPMSDISEAFRLSRQRVSKIVGSTSPTRGLD